MRRVKKAQRRNKLLLRAGLLLCAGVIGYFVAGDINPRTNSAKNTQIQKEEIDPETHFVVYEQKVKPLMEHYCYDCHGDGSDKGDLDMDRFTSFASMTQDRETWDKIRGHLKLKLMPPVDEEQPETKEVQTITQWIDNTIFHTDPENPDPGKVVIRRLNRNEYQNTILDLFGVSVDTEALLPLDDTGYGFDTISDVHSVSPAHIEKYLTAAEIALNKAVVIGPMPWKTRHFQPNKLRHHPARNKNGRFIVNGNAQLPRKVMENLTPGTYQLEIEASSSAGGDEDAILEVKTNQLSKAKFKIPAKSTDTLCKVIVPITNQTKLTMNFINDFYDAKHPDPNRRDRNLIIRNVRLIGPLDRDRPEKPATHNAIFPLRTVAQTDEQYALEVWSKFAAKAFRRPVSADEIRSYTQFIKPNNSTEEELQRQILLGLQAMLVSPHFLFIQSTAENDKHGTSLITELALASRLSYFLWSSAPDQQLIQLASNNQLRENLTREIDRMLDDPRAYRLIQNFTGQWLQLRDLKVHSPDSKLFPRWNKSLREDAVRETEQFIYHLIKNNLNALDCLDSDYTFLNQNLAAFYGIKGITREHIRKVSLKGSQLNQRGGLLGHASILTLTSYPDRTSPVLRGKWVLENILGTPPPPPPVDIPDLQPSEKHEAHKSLRKQLEDHRKKAECAACHNLLDPLGFALQNYDGIGKWRTREQGALIDTTGKLISGETIQDGASLRNVLKSNKSEDFMRCLTEKLLTYGIGRGIEYYDKPAIDQILKKSETNNHSFRKLIHSVCESVPFQMTRTNNHKLR